MRYLSTVLLSLCLAASIRAESEDGREIMRKSQAATRLRGMESVATLTIRDKKGNERVRRFSSASKKYGDVTRMIMKFLEPADVKGTGVLTFDNEDEDDDMWVYMPALRKTRRIVSSEKAKGFMGSEFSNADITAPTLDDFTYTLLGSEKTGGVDCRKVEAVPVSDDVAEEYGYSRKIVWVGATDYVTRKTDIYDLDGELLKVLTVYKVELLDEKNGKYQTTDVEAENVQNGRSSRFTIEKVELNPDVKDEYFTTQYLEK